MNKKSESVILDDKALSPEQKESLHAFLKSQPEVESLGAFIPEMRASAEGIGKALIGAFTTIYVNLPKGLTSTAVDIAKGLVSKWLEKQLISTKEKPPIEYVTLYDAYKHPVVKVEKPPVRVNKL